MVGLEGEACTEKKYKRYEKEVREDEEECRCADPICELEWCQKYTHDWKLDLDLATTLFEDGENSFLTIHTDANADDTGDQVIYRDIDASLSSSWEASKAKYGNRR